MIDQARAPSPFRWRVERQDVGECRCWRAERPSAEADAVVRRVFADRAGFAVKGSGKVGDCDSVSVGEIQRTGFVGAERPDVAVDEPEQVGAAEHGGLGAPELGGERVVGHLPVMVAEERLLGLGPIRSHPPSIAVGMRAAQAEIFGAPAKRACGAAEPRPERREACRRLIGVTEQCVLVGRPGAAPASTVAELTDDLSEAGQGARGKAFRRHHRGDLRIAVAFRREVERASHLGLAPVGWVAGVADAEYPRSPGESAQRSADEGGELEQRNAAGVAGAQLRVLPRGPFRGVALG